jgi:glycosyltransferase involved in cell wall biosynthesis
MKISICVPTYEMHGSGGIYLGALFDSIERQTYKDFEVIISDHSQDDGVMSICEEWTQKIQVRYYRNTEGRGNASININNAIRQARGEVIKPMHQDDFFYSDHCLASIAEALQKTPGSSWGVCGYMHTDAEGARFFRYRVPFYNRNIIKADNTIGAPAVLFYRNDGELFDEKLIWMNDCELYYRLFVRHGLPIVIKEPLIAIRLWGNQVTTSISKQKEEFEIAHSLSKYGIARRPIGDILYRLFNKARVCARI